MSIRRISWRRLVSLFLWWILRVHVDNGMIWLGTERSSWIWLSRGSTRRTRVRPRGGACARISVEKGNDLTARSAVLIAIAYAHRLIWLLEQPDSSLIKIHPALNAVRRRMRQRGEMWWQVQTVMGAFGGPTTKGHELCSNSEFMSKLRRSHPGAICNGVETAKKSVDKRGKQIVTGREDHSDSQEYTPALGEDVATAFLEYRHDENCVSAMLSYETEDES